MIIDAYFLTKVKFKAKSNIARTCDNS